MKISGKVWKYGDDINTDYIYQGIHTYVMKTDDEMGAHAMEEFDPDFNSNAAKGDIIVAGKNWGCGSSREQAVKCLKSRGIGAVIATSVGRIYYRNAINEGFPIIICPDAVKTTRAGEMIVIDFGAGVITNEQNSYSFQPYSEHVQRLMDCGGLLPYIKQRIQNNP